MGCTYTVSCVLFIVQNQWFGQVGMEAVLQNVERGNEDATLASLTSFNDKVCYVWLYGLWHLINLLTDYNSCTLDGKLLSRTWKLNWTM